MKKCLILGSLLMVCTLRVMAEPLDSVVAVVNDGVVTQSEFDEAYVQYQQQLRARKAPVPSEDVLKKQVLNHLINESLQLQMAKHSGVAVDDVELDETIQKIASENHLSLTAFREALAKEGLTFEGYRETIRKEMLMARIQQQAVGPDVMVSNEQVEDYLKTSLALEKTSGAFHVQNILIPLEDEPTPAQLRNAEKKAQQLLQKVKEGVAFEQLAILASSDEYPLDSGDLGQRHLAELPDIFAKRVVDMSEGEVAGPLRAGNGLQLIKLVSVTRPDKHHEVLKTHVRHILVKPDASTTEAEARRRVDNLYEQLKSGKSFAALAKQYSADLANADKGGDLGWITPEELVPAFSEVMTALKPGQVSRPVKTTFGWHLIEVLERKTVDDSDAFERQQVRQFLHRRKFAEAVESWQQHVRGTSYVQILKKELA